VKLYRLIDNLARELWWPHHPSRTKSVALAALERGDPGRVEVEFGDFVKIAKDFVKIAEGIGRNTEGRMSNFPRAAYHPKEKVVRAAMFVDDYFGQHEYGVCFLGDEHVYKPAEVEIPLDIVFIPSERGALKPS